MPPAKGFFKDKNRREYEKYLRLLDDVITHYFEVIMITSIKEREKKKNEKIIIGGNPLDIDELYSKVIVPFCNRPKIPESVFRFFNAEGEAEAKKLLLEREEFIAKLPGCRLLPRPEIIDEWIEDEGQK